MRISCCSTLLLLLSLAFLSACGQKGPLYLPGNPSTLQSIPTAEQLRRAAEEDAEEEEDENEQDPTIIQ